MVLVFSLVKLDTIFLIIKKRIRTKYYLLIHIKSFLSGGWFIETVEFQKKVDKNTYF